MISGHDILTISARAAIGRPLPPFAVTPEQAAAMLNEPARTIPDTNARGVHQGVDETDPVQFAEGVDGLDWMHYFEHGAPVEMAEFKQAMDTLIDHLGIGSEEARGYNHPLTKVDESVLALWCAAWAAGVRAGAAYEHLRLALVPARMTCRTCDGKGRTWGGHWYRDDAKPMAVCADCGGAGTVATPAATLPFEQLGQG